MSRSLNIIGIYKNNKSRTIGCYNGKNAETYHNISLFDSKDKNHLIEMYNKYLLPEINKFKAFRIIYDISGNSDNYIKKEVLSNSKHVFNEMLKKYEECNSINISKKTK